MPGNCPSEETPHEHLSGIGRLVPTAKADDWGAVMVSWGAGRVGRGHQVGGRKDEAGLHSSPASRVFAKTVSRKGQRSRPEAPT